MAWINHMYKVLLFIAVFIIINVCVFVMNSYDVGPSFRNIISFGVEKGTPNNTKNSHPLSLTKSSTEWSLLPKLNIFKATVYPNLEAVTPTAPKPKPAATTQAPPGNATESELSYEQFCALSTAAGKKGCDVPSIKVFYNKYRERCLVQKHPQGKTYCACFPKTLVGWEDQTVTVPLSNPSAYDLDPKPLGVLPGGRWAPTGCEPRQRIAIIVPYRNREEQLKVFAKRINVFLRRQQHEYQVFVIEQNEPKTFSRAALMNVGFLEANKSNFDCFIFSDVDLLPEDDRYMYDCFYSPLHIGAYVSKFNYKTLYTTIFGGISALSKEHALTTNLFGNRFYGWGGEDDDLYNRVMAHGLTLYRYPNIIGRTFMIKHINEKGNERNAFRFDGTKEYSRAVYRADGMRQTQYKVLKRSEDPLYTKINIDLLPLKPEPECLQKKGENGTEDVYTICWGDPNFKSGNLDCCGKGCCHKTKPAAPTSRAKIHKIT